ncbi:MAG TPA: S9 family peptidase, partial [Verrucomicrobiales bacterium]|nr:S9 family peptidase [Verrucomicrobiales bacterium]
MRITNIVRSSILLFLSAYLSANGQGSFQDYERAGGLRKQFSGKVFKDRVEPHWDEKGDGFWYRNSVGEDKYEFIAVNCLMGSRERAFDHDTLASRLSDESGQSVSPLGLPFSIIRLDSESKSIGFDAFGKVWDFNPESGELKTFGKVIEDSVESADGERDRRRGRRGSRQQGSRSESKSPDGIWEAFFRNHNFFLRESASGKETQFSFEGNSQDGYGDQVYWAPDSSKVVVYRVSKAQEHKVYLVESSPDDQVQPKLQERDYLKPGDQLETRKPHLFDIKRQVEIPISEALFSNPWSNRGLRWASDSSRFTFTYNQRGHQVLRIIAVDAATGQAVALVDESSDTFIDYAYKQFTHYLNETGEIIWMSERNGWNHLYLYDSSSGKVKNQITQGAWVVRGVDKVDQENRLIWFRAGGVYPDQDPYYIHYGRIRFDGSDLAWLTSGDGTHELHYSSDRRFFVDSYSRVDLAPTHELHESENGDLICVLEKSDVSKLLESGWHAPERFVAKGRDGKTDIYGIIFRPTHFDSEKNYPVVEHIYAGPHGSYVPKNFRVYHSSQYIAELGFIVVRIDGMGTSNRSKAFHDVCWKNLKDSGFPDRTLWMQAAASKYSFMDLSRVGIYGGSAGGQSTMSALLHFPDFYKVGVADCGCHDNRMDKVWWNELWMGWPIGPHYADNSNVTHAGKLQGKLFLTVGELDRNVDPASTLQVVDALIKAGKDFDFLIVPGAGHGVGETPYMARRRADYFVRHLLKVEPRWASIESLSGVTEIPISLTDKWTLDPFYEKHLDAEGLPILASSKVDDHALLEARYLINQMLKGREDIRSALIKNQFRFTVMAFNEFTTDVPEHRDLTPKDFWDRRARGLGPTRKRPSVSCGEENLLKYPGDPYHAENILVHEFAHAIHEGLKSTDADFDSTLKSIYQSAMEAG